MNYYIIEFSRKGGLIGLGSSFRMTRSAQPGDTLDDWLEGTLSIMPGWSATAFPVDATAYFPAKDESLRFERQMTAKAWQPPDYVE